MIPPREFSLTVAVACTCVTGTARAGRPYTTACSPKSMILPGAEAEEVVTGWMRIRTALRYIENSQNGQSPQENGNLEGAVRQQDHFWFAADLPDLDEVKIAEDGIDNERDGQH